MAKRWSADDIDELKNLAQTYSVQAIAEKMDRSVGGVAFKARQLGVPLKSRAQAADLSYPDFDWANSGENQPAPFNEPVDVCALTDTESHTDCCLFSWIVTKWLRGANF